MSKAAFNSGFLAITLLTQALCAQSTANSSPLSFLGNGRKLLPCITIQTEFSFLFRHRCGNATDVPPLAVLLVYYSHLLFGIDVVLNKISSISQLNASFANSAIKIICVWLVATDLQNQYSQPVIKFFIDVLFQVHDMPRRF
jgi:hypothetical protein